MSQLNTNKSTFSSFFPDVYIATEKGITKNRLKIYPNNQLFIDNNTEFQLEFENYSSKTFKALIKLNNILISNSGLVLRPGEHVYLERYLDIDKKFLFTTYEVDSNSFALKAIEHNGEVEIEFYQEVVPMTTWSTSFVPQNPPIPYIDDYPYWRWETPQYTLSGGYSVPKNNIIRPCMNIQESNFNKIETGRIEQGSNSGQNFNQVDMNFQLFASKIVKYKILPLSQLKIEKVRQYCTGCGYRIREDSWKWCPKCGTTLH